MPGAASKVRKGVLVQFWKMPVAVKSLAAMPQVGNEAGMTPGQRYKPDDDSRTPGLTPDTPRGALLLRTMACSALVHASDGTGVKPKYEGHTPKRTTRTPKVAQ
jgi:hypothetical protein